jgi:hypothetical protein
MKNLDLYRRLAADGNKDAQAILDAEKEGAFPEKEAGEEESEGLEAKKDKAEEEESEESDED